MASDDPKTITDWPQDHGIQCVLNETDKKLRPI